ncbi:MAG: hypothetical protein ACI88L_000711 [Candidatus Paceibacteria bacterium]|jgi:uncharacterized protein YqeY
MSLQVEIKESLKESMKAKDSVRLSVVRNILTSITNELVSKGKTPQDSLGDDDVLTVIKRLSKQRKDSIDQFEKGGRPELAEVEKVELAILEKYLPELMSQENIRPIAEAKKIELGIDDPAKKGQLMGAVMKELAGRADGTDVKAVVDLLFN